MRRADIQEQRVPHLAIFLSLILKPMQKQSAGAFKVKNFHRREIWGAFSLPLLRCKQTLMHTHRHTHPAWTLEPARPGLGMKR